MRALVIGASGLLGNAILRDWSARPGWKVEGTYFKQPLPGLSQLDVRDLSAVRQALSRARPEVAAIMASEPHVDLCQTNPGETRLLNVDAPVAAARAALEAGAEVLCFSTDYVFDGERGGYTEQDEPRPINEYGRQKLALERGLAALGGRVLTLRVSALFGWELRPRNFVLKVARGLGAGQAFKAASDQDYNPTYVEDLARAAGDLAEKGASGLLHLAGPDRVTRAELAGLVAEAFGVDRSLVIPVPLRELASGAPRPLHSSLDSSRAETLLGRKLRPAREALAHMHKTRRQWESYAAGVLPVG